MNNPHVFFLTGDSGIGKSTLLIDVIKKNQLLLSGFFVHRVLNKKHEIEGFELCSANSVYQDRHNREGTRFIWKNKIEHVYDSTVFSKLGIELLKATFKETNSVILLDEIGGVELIEKDFFIELLKVLELPNKIIGVFKSNKNYNQQQKTHTDDLKMIHHRQQLENKINEQGLLVELTEENRQQVEQQLKKFMRS